MPRNKTKRNKHKTKKVKRKVARRVSIAVRRSSGRKEKFDLDRMAQTTSRSGVPFIMARDVAKSVSKKIRSEARAKGKNKTITAARVRKMIFTELKNRNQQTIASSYAGETPENSRYAEAKVGDSDQHVPYGGEKNSVMHDRSKRLTSAA
jgi:hypothetical protein